MFMLPFIFMVVDCLLELKAICSGFTLLVHPSFICTVRVVSSLVFCLVLFYICLFTPTMAKRKRTNYEWSIQLYTEEKNVANESGAPKWWPFVLQWWHSSRFWYKCKEIVLYTSMFVHVYICCSCCSVLNYLRSAFSYMCCHWRSMI